MSSTLDLSDLRRANVARQEEWCPDQKPDLAYRGNELAGEVGEACNIIKKLERERHGWRGSRSSIEALASELADVVICTDLAAHAAGIDLGAAVRSAFNATSEKNGLAARLAAPPGEALREAWAVIAFAQTIDDHYDMREFLKGWSEGDVSEWPEFTDKLAASASEGEAA